MDSRWLHEEGRGRADTFTGSQSRGSAPNSSHSSLSHSERPSAHATERESEPGVNSVVLHDNNDIISTPSMVANRRNSVGPNEPGVTRTVDTPRLALSARSNMRASRQITPLLTEVVHPEQMETHMEKKRRVDRVARCANKLQRWGKGKRVKFKQEIEECVREMEALRDNQGEVESGRFQECSNKHATLLVQKEGYWKQRAKMHWLQEGDLNTRFFHMSASSRSKKKKITNLMDDAANVAEVTQLLSILQTYEQASGQEINLSKSEVFISRNMSQAAQADLAGILGVRHVLGTGIYLGLPSMVGRSKKAIFSYIKDRIWKRINSWRGRALSKAGKEIMIKSVLQAIPTYVMSMFILPSSFIDDIEKMINAFWWGGGNGNSKGIHWLAWERLACPKDKGGLGFRNFEAFNMAMVAKQAWKILQNPDTLVARLIKARYFPRSTLLEASLGYNPSFAWRSIWKARQVLLLGCRWRIGGGDKIHVMSDPWLRGNGERWIPSPQPEGMYNLFVRDLMVDNYKAWNVSKIRMLFPVQVAERIIATPLIGSVYVDKMVWEEERNGCYSVKSGYKLAMKCIFRNDKYHVKVSWLCRRWSLLSGGGHGGLWSLLQGLSEVNVE
ncbi:unnamed protein product [Trifolium pratense]|uniref:Uncharacterized protein n=1 Tax=Trifolium pratense TaxID=57577 RepID=A0ACB0LJN0_TRIPR|nr:unnamed protein product [Trifolium pratense]